MNIIEATQVLLDFLATLPEDEEGVATDTHEATGVAQTFGVDHADLVDWSAHQSERIVNIVIKDFLQDPDANSLDILATNIFHTVKQAFIVGCIYTRENIAELKAQLGEEQ